MELDKREDRELARQMIADDDPERIIGSPHCTAFSIWNRQMNYRKMPVDKMRAAIEEGDRHLNFCSYLHRRQLLRSKHFLYEHPARALSWVHPQMAAICKMHGVHLVTADPCMYGLETPSTIDGSPAPAMKPTRFLTSSIHMARRLQKQLRPQSRASAIGWLALQRRSLLSVAADQNYAESYA